MKILITGGAGFIGAWLGKALHERGDEVIAVDDFSSINYPAAIKELRVKELLKEVRVERISILEFDTLLKLFQETQPDIIVHFAAAPGVRNSSKQPLTYARVNVEGTASVFEAAKQAGIARVIYASSSSVYSMIEIPFTEEHMIKEVTSMYAATKRATELIAGVYWHTTRIKVTGIRFFNVYGPWGRPDTVPYIFTDAILQHKPIELKYGGDISRDFTSVHDIVRGVISIIELPGRNAHRELVNLGNSSPVLLKDLVAKLENIADMKTDKHFDQGMPREDPINTYADITYAKEEYGWEPQVSLDEGLREMVDWHRKYINGDYNK